MKTELEIVRIEMSQSPTYHTYYVPNESCSVEGHHLNSYRKLSCVAPLSIGSFNLNKYRWHWVTDYLDLYQRITLTWRANEERCQRGRHVGP